MPLSPPMPDASASKPVQLLRLVRPTQWAKSVFVLIGPFYALADEGLTLADSLWRAVVAAIAFSLVSSAMYIVNDILDAEADRAHPRKQNRPIASGAVSPREGLVLSTVLVVASGAAVFLLPETPARLWLGAILIAYVANVAAYSVLFKHHVIADVMSLSIGFVLRVFAGCVAISVTPSVEWRSRAISLVTFMPGSCPPSPGLAPCATLISSSSQWFRYSAVTPKRPEATCLILADGLSPLGSGTKCAGSSPPSPESDFAPIRFIATFSVLCASGDSAPSDMPGVTKRLRIAVMLSTSSMGMAGPSGLMSSRSRRWIGGFDFILAEYCFHSS